MKKKLVTFLMILVMCVVGVSFSNTQVEAEGLGTDIPFSDLQTPDALVGYAQAQTRGIYLLNGTSVINKIDNRTVGAGGTTNAALKCKVSILVIVEQLDDGYWDYWTSWSVTEQNAFSVMASRAIAVAPGHYYRVRCTHSAASDVSSSWTGALSM